MSPFLSFLSPFLSPLFFLLLPQSIVKGVVHGAALEGALRRRAACPWNRPSPISRTTSWWKSRPTTFACANARFVPTNANARPGRPSPPEWYVLGGSGGGTRTPNTPIRVRFAPERGHPARYEKCNFGKAPECPLWVISRRFETTLQMSAFGGKADSNHRTIKRPLLAINGHLFQQRRRLSTSAIRPRIWWIPSAYTGAADRDTPFCFTLLLSAMTTCSQNAFVH